MEGTDFVLPTTEGGGFAGLQASATELLNKVNTIPFKQIGDNLDGILRSANDVANGPQMKQALTDLAGDVGKLKNLVAHLDSGLSPAMQQLPEIATGLQKTLTNVNKLVLSLDTGYGDNTQFNRDLETAAGAGERCAPLDPLARRSAGAPSGGSDQGSAGGRSRMNPCTAIVCVSSRLALIVALAACSSPNPALYTIAPVTGRRAERGTEGDPAAADRPASATWSARRSSARPKTIRLDVMSNDWWGEPLAAMLGRVLVERTWPAPAAEHRAQRERRRVGAARCHDRTERSAARRGRNGQSRAAGPGQRELQSRGQRRRCGASASPCRHRRRACRARSQRSAPRSASLPTAWRLSLAGPTGR